MSYITKTLVENPSRVYTLQYFAGRLDCGKSTVSEDAFMIGKLFEDLKLGEINSISGASGGICFLPTLTAEQIRNLQEDLCDLINDKKRIIPGGFLYMNDLFFNPRGLKAVARAMVSQFHKLEFDYVVTIETKGIPLATILGEMLNKPIIVIRKSSRMTEGPTIQMNYLTGSLRTIKTMVLPLRAIERGSKVLFVDDFMKAGGTAKGVIDLMKELDVEVVAIGVVMSTKEPETKLVDSFYSLIELESIDEKEETIRIIPKSK